LKKSFSAYILLGLIFFTFACTKEKSPPEAQAENVKPAAVKKTEKTEKLNIPITTTDEDYSTIFFVSGGIDTCELYSIGSNGKKLKKLFSAWIKSAVRVSPNGKRFTFNSHSSEWKEDCQAVYDSQRDTLILLRQPDGGVGWYPRWWDNDHIYYRSMGYIYKQNIHTGVFEKITRTRLNKWLDPIWIPELKKFVNVELDSIGTFNMDGSGYSADSLPYRHNTESPPILIRQNGKFMVGYNTGNATKGWAVDEPKPKEWFTIVDLNGRVQININPHNYLQSNRMLSSSCDESGKWMYFTDRLIRDDQETLYILKRQNSVDTNSVQTIAYSTEYTFDYLSVYKERP